MQTMILNHYPPVIQQIRHIQEIAKAEDNEFKKLNAGIDRIVRNMYVFTADETGVKQFEQLLGIEPKTGQSIDDRKVSIIFKINQKKMSLSELTSMLADYCEGIRLINDMTNMEMTIEMNASTISVETINNMLDEILPLNIYIQFMRHLTCRMSICYRNAVFAQVSFHPRQPSELLKLSGKWKLDGTHKLSSYDSDGYVDCYPVRSDAKIHVTIPINGDSGTTQWIMTNVGTGYSIGTYARAAAYIRNPRYNYDSVQAGVHASVQVSPSVSDGSVRIVKRLTGNWKLDGKRKLNAGTYSL